MTNVTQGRPVRTDAPRTLERFHIYLLLVLGIAFVGAGIIAIGFGINSSAAVGLGAGAVVAAGLIAIFFALLSIGRTIPSDATEASGDPDHENQRPVWPPKTSRRSPIE
jgi:hypothetical protein